LSVPPRNGRVAIAATGRFMQRLRVSHKVLLGGLLLLLPLFALLRFFSENLGVTIAATERARCGLAYDAEARRLLEQTLEDGVLRTATRDALSGLANWSHPTCGHAPAAEILHVLAVAQAIDLAWAAPTEPALLRSHLHSLRADIGDHSGLILDPDLDTYYVVDFLFNRFPEGIELLADNGPIAEDLIDAHRRRLDQGLATAIEHNDYHHGSRGTLEAAIRDPRDRYLARLDTLTADQSAGARKHARDALLQLYDAAAGWGDRGLSARIAEVRARLLRTYLTVAMVLLLAGGFAWLTVRNSVRRLNELVSISERMAHGELGLAVEVHGSDELAQLQHSFNTMAAQLQAWYIDLEQRVTERTAAAQSAEQGLRSVIESAPYGIMLCDADGTILLVNSQIETLFGYQRDELLGQPVELLVPAAQQARHRQQREHYHQRPSTRAMGAGRELHGLRRDGSEVPLEIGLSTLQTGSGTQVLAAVIDISARKADERRLRQAESAAERGALLDKLPASVIATDIKGRIIACNRTAERLLGCGRDQLLGRLLLQLRDAGPTHQPTPWRSDADGKDLPVGMNPLSAAALHDPFDVQEWTLVRRDGTRVPVRIALSAMRDAGGALDGYLCVAEDISARRNAEAYIDYMAQHDAMTGLPNRRLLLERIDLALGRMSQSDLNVAVLLVDLDQFKHINDTMGHRAGDQLLVIIADRLERACGEPLTVARPGGDEFVIVVPDVDSPGSLAPLIARLQQAIAEPMNIDGQALGMSASVGAALSGPEACEATILLKNAETALYQAKARGRGTALWFSGEMLQASQDTVRLGVALRSALEHDELSLHYQPEVSLRTGRIIGIEALLRWRHGGEDIEPGRFIPLAEDSGLILRLGEWVLQRACLDCMQLQQRIGHRLSVAVNVSPMQLLQADWQQIVTGALERSGLHPNQLELEITEGMLVSRPEEGFEALNAVRALGVAVAVDDFGTGYSSLAYLTRLPVDKVKIDRSFVRNLPGNIADSAIVNAILAMAQHLKLRTVAEGVELPAQRDYLQQRGCDEAQGFLYSRALPLDELVERFDQIEAAVRLQRDTRGDSHLA
jgi:diguanylate cyclase (GGDEF)-like protein/PAS domain S-box-containing protein